MESVREVIAQNNISLSIPIYGANDIATGWEIKSIVESQEALLDYYSNNVFNDISCLDDYYAYHIALKLISFRDIVPRLINEEHKPIVSSVSDCAEKSIALVENGELIRFINNSASEIFKKESFDDYYDVYDVTLDIIAKYITGFKKEVFETLCKECRYLLIDRFDQFEKAFEQYPDLFDQLYPVNDLQYINQSNFEKTLDIWFHILKKGKSNLKDPVKKQINLLFDDLKTLADGSTIDNIFINEGPIRVFNEFLQHIQSQKANEFEPIAKSAEALLSQYIVERGQCFSTEIPVDTILNKRNQSKNWEVRLLLTTHSIRNNEDGIEISSWLSLEPDSELSIMDLVSTNIPTDDFYSFSYQQKLDGIISVGTAEILGIFHNDKMLNDYITQIISAISIISSYLNTDTDQLVQDVKMLANQIVTITKSIAAENVALQGLCYGATMYMCALSEKLLRLFYKQLTIKEKYIPLNKATLGGLLSTSNAHMVQIFGEVHLKNLSFFLLQDSTTGIGKNIRNGLAHWSGFTPSEMNISFLAKMMWIFTDILNTIFWYYLKDNETGENNE